MSELGDSFREWRDHKREVRRKHTENCIGCGRYYPKANPTKMFPGQQCRVCGYTRSKDGQSWIDQEGRRV